MKRKNVLTMLVLSLLTLHVSAQDIQLPEPEKNGGSSLMDLLNERESVRSFSSKELSRLQLSNLLWAGFGYNKHGKRTAPSASNKQEIDIYVALSSGVYIYDAKNNLLKQISDQDMRAMTGKQDFVKDAPVNLIFVADKSKMNQGDDISMHGTLNIDCGYISQNIYLYCTSANLGTVVRGGGIDRNALGKAIGLNTDQVIIVCQTVGHKK